MLNAAKIALTGAKMDQKMYYRHSGYPGGFKGDAIRVELEKRPERVIERAVRGMVPHTALGKKQLGKLQVYAGPSIRTPGRSPSSQRRDRREATS